MSTREYAMKSNIIIALTIALIAASIALGSTYARLEETPSIVFPLIAGAAAAFVLALEIGGRIRRQRIQQQSETETESWQ